MPAAIAERRPAIYRVDNGGCFRLNEKRGRSGTGAKKSRELIPVQTQNKRNCTKWKDLQKTMDVLFIRFHFTTVTCVGHIPNGGRPMHKKS